jgi:hypothetical protein
MDLYNDPVSFDQSLIMGKLGYEDELPQHVPNMNVNDRIRLALLEQKVKEKSEQQIEPKQVRSDYHRRDGFCDCGGTAEGMKSKPKKEAYDDEMVFGIPLKTFLFIVCFILAIVCVAQYFTYKEDMHNLMSIISVLVTNNKPESSVPQAVQSVPQAVQSVPQSVQSAPQAVQAVPQAVSS